MADGNRRTADSGQRTAHGGRTANGGWSADGGKTAGVFVRHLRLKRLDPNDDLAYVFKLWASLVCLGHPPSSLGGALGVT